MRFAVVAATLALIGCTQVEGLPGDFEALPGAAGLTAQSTDFDLAQELQIATSACVASELSGPAALDSLRSRGYTAFREADRVKYGKLSPNSEKGLLTGGRRAVIVSDPNGPIPCTIEIPRSKGYTGMSLAAAALAAQGYRPAGGTDSLPRFAKDGVVFGLSGSQSRYSDLAALQISRIASK